MRARRIIGAGLYVLAALSAIPPALAQEVHYSPEERLDAIDAALIVGAQRSIDFASYSLMDSAVLDALNDAERRGVVIRIVLDPRERHDFVKLGDLSDNVRIKRGGPSRTPVSAKCGSAVPVSRLTPFDDRRISVALGLERQQGQKTRRLGWPWGACADDLGEGGDVLASWDVEASAEIVPEGDAELGAGLV